MAPCNLNSSSTWTKSVVDNDYSPEWCQGNVPAPAKNRPRFSSHDAIDVTVT